MSLFEGTAPPNVESTRTTTATAPQYLTDYLTDLAKTGQAQLAKPPEELIAALPSNLQDLYKNAETVLGRYQAPLTSGAAAAESAAKKVTGADISAFYDPYQASVVNELARQSQQGVQRILLPQLRSAFAGTGGFGGQRYAGATGQALADVQSALTGKQAELMSTGYKSALDAALRQNAQEIQAAQVLGQIGQAESQAGTAATKALGDIGAQQLAYEQSKIEAPLTRAQNVAQIMRGYTYPTTTTELYKGPANVYGPSPLSQIAGLGSLIGAVTKGSAGSQLADLFKSATGGGGWLDQILYPSGNPLQTGEYSDPGYWT